MLRECRFYYETVNNRCVLGVCNQTNTSGCAYVPDPDFDPTNPCPGLFDACGTGAITGADGKPGAIGFYAANEFIQGQPSAVLPGYIGNLVYRTEWNFGLNSLILPPTSIWKYVLAAIGGVGKFTEIHGPPLQIILKASKKDIAQFLVHDGVKKHWEHLILLNRLLYGTQHKNNGDEIIIPNAYYECLLDAAPCRGHDGIESIVNEEWGWTDRLGGDRANGQANSDAHSRVDFAFYFNLYNEINPGYLGNQYVSTPIKDLAIENIDKNNYTEYDKKNFMAANSITAHNNYIIDNDNFEGQGRVTFVAGKTIDLLPGFNVTSGATLNAYIDPTIGQMTCIEPAVTDCNFLEVGLKFTPDSTDPETFDTLQILFQDATLRFANPITEPEETTFDISIIPNPSTGIFNLICKNALQSVEVRDMLGNLVHNKIANNNSRNVDIDISNNPPGIYFLKARSTDKVYTEKVILH
ncbi:MAG: T9SS type A sorting domain-containing protein [Bacteroidetes bacterium]|nr:MAG: T9SS type A sorting domain-containing protein [Bacteroidota bacterium]